MGFSTQLPWQRIFLPWVLILTLLLPAVVQAQFTCTTNNGTLTITGYSGPGGEVTIPDAIAGLPVTGIGAFALYRVPGLTSVAIPANVTEIAMGAFGACDALTNILVDALNPAYGSLSGVLFSKDRTTIVQFPGGIAGTYTIPGSVTNIESSAFTGCAGLTGVVIPNGVTRVGDSAFHNCAGLAAATLPNGLASLGSYAFYGCGSLPGMIIPGNIADLGAGTFGNCAGLTSVTLPDSVTNIENGVFTQCTGLASVAIPSNVASIGPEAFSGCASLTSITVPERVTSIAANLFAGCNNLTNVSLPANINNIDGAAFANCSSLSGIQIPAGVSAIGGAVFYGCTSLASVILPNSVTNVGGSAFFGCTSLTNLVLSGSIASVADSTCEGCTSLPGITIPGSVTNIGSRAFYQCGNLLTVNLPGSVTVIGDWAFYFCTSLPGIEIPRGVVEIGTYAFYSCTALTNVSMPESLMSIGSSAFAYCSSLSSMAIPDSVTYIGDRAFSACLNLPAITVGPLNALYCSVDGVLFDKKQTTLIAFPGGRAGGYTIPNGTAGIGGFAFDHCLNLTRVTIPWSVKNLSIGAFAFCPQLVGVYFEGNAPGLGSSVFSGDNRATIYYLPGTTGWSSMYGGRPTARWVLPYPVILTTAPGFGMQTNKFRFTISWATNVPVIVDAATTLADPAWSPMSTNTLVNGSFYFADPDWTNYPARFYRVRWP